MSDDSRNPLSDPIFRRISRLADAMGVRAYVVGGYVRDYYLGRPSTDIDVVVVGSEGWGNALVLIAVLSIAANTVIIKPQLQRFGTLWVMGWYYLIGVAITFPFFKDYIDLNRLYTLPPGALAETGILLIFGTVLPMYLLYRGTERLTSVHTALYRYIQPLVATTLALARHQETVDQIHLLAGGAIFGGVLLMVLGTVLARRKQRAEMLKQP